jgi:hypothetical protein
MSYKPEAPPKPSPMGKALKTVGSEFVLMVIIICVKIVDLNGRFLSPSFQFKKLSFF